MFESCMIGLFITEFMVSLTNHQLVIMAHLFVFSFFFSLLVITVVLHDTQIERFS